MKQYQLSTSVIAEPLILQWYAQPWLYSPKTAAFLLINEKLPLLEQYLEDSDIANQANQWQELKNAAFVALDNKHFNAVENLYNLMKGCLQKHHDFIATFFELNEAILKNDSIEQAEQLIKTLPEGLRPYVEIYYELNHQLQFSLSEPLLYHSNYFLKDKQSIRLYSTTTDERPPVNTTPRVDFNNSNQIHQPFDSDWLSQLFQTRFKPTTAEELKDTLDIDISDSQWSQHFTEHKPNKNDCFEGTKYIGHASLLMSHQGKHILIDPVIPAKYTNCSDRYSWDDLPSRIDAILITHSHTDHFNIETLMQLKGITNNIIVPSTSPFLLDPSLKRILENLGFKQITVVDPLDNIALSDAFKITAIPFQGEHAGFGIMGKTGYCIQRNQHKSLALADCNILNPSTYEFIQNKIGDVDAIFISLECEGAPLDWLVKPFYKDTIPWEISSKRKWVAADAQQIIQLCQIFSCNNVYLYAMGFEPWLKPIMEVDYDNKISNELKALRRNCLFNKINLNILKTPRVLQSTPQSVRQSVV